MDGVDWSSVRSSLQKFSKVWSWLNRPWKNTRDKFVEQFHHLKVNSLSVGSLLQKFSKVRSLFDLPCKISWNGFLRISPCDGGLVIYRTLQKFWKNCRNSGKTIHSIWWIKSLQMNSCQISSSNVGFVICRALAAEILKSPLSIQLTM